jgi:hypothetical protein
MCGVDPKRFSFPEQQQTERMVQVRIGQEDALDRRAAQSSGAGLEWREVLDLRSKIR